MSKPLRVAIVGAGVGGLALANGLVRQGHAVAVYERDPTPDFRKQGYRLTIWPDAVAAIARLAGPQVATGFAAASSPWGAGLHSVDEHNRTIFRTQGDPGRGGGRSIDRMRLREILLDSIRSHLVFGQPVTDFSQQDDGVELHFAEGPRRRHDLLVIANGHASNLRGRLLPAHARLLHTGMVDIAARLPFTPALTRLAERLGFADQSLLLVNAADGATMVIIPQLFGADRQAIFGGSEPPSPEDYLYWGLIGPLASLGAEAAAGDGQALIDHAGRVTGDWSPLFRELVAGATTDAIDLLHLRTSVRPEPWPSSRVTLLGDAIHAMVPLRGQGANMAILDADSLVREMAGGGDPVAIVARYEREMIARAFPMVESSLAELRRLTGS